MHESSVRFLRVVVCLQMLRFVPAVTLLNMDGFDAPVKIP